jgi:AhpD family alkylhydroperoxidase
VQTERLVCLQLLKDFLDQCLVLVGSTGFNAVSYQNALHLQAPLRVTNPQEASMNPDTIEGGRGRLQELTPDVIRALNQLRKASYGEGVLPSRIKIGVGLAISAAIRCEPCIEGYARSAAKSGLSLEELVELLNVVITMQGCAGEPWARKALTAFERGA